MKSLTPSEIVKALDKYIIGQEEAKKSVAVALRNRYRRTLIPEEMREEITPKNILMMGPTGVGKTEIARRLAKLVDAPFIKVEATKFTEVGYVGRDVDSMIRDLVESSVRLTKNKYMKEKYEIAEKIAEEKIVEAILPSSKKKKSQSTGGVKSPFDFILNASSPKPEKEEDKGTPENTESKAEAEAEQVLAKEQVLQQLRDGLLEEHLIEIEVNDQNNALNTLDLGNEGMSIGIGSILGDMMPPKKPKRKKVFVKDARKILKEQEAQNLIDMDMVTSEALENAEQNGIIFIDEIDKIASGDQRSSGNVSREGVQRDILPIVEGSVVNTKYGPIKTDYILFIGAGAFHISKPTDLIPELQGRFPIRVELQHLTKEVFKQILIDTENALVKQNVMLLETEGVKVSFTDDAIEEIAEIAFLINEQTENIGARRLHTAMEKLLEDISFEIPDMKEKNEIRIDKEYVVEKFKHKTLVQDVNKFIL